MKGLGWVALAAVLRAAALPGWVWGPLVLLGVAARVAGWERGAAARADFLGGFLYWLLAFSFLVHVHLLAPVGAALILSVCWWIEGWLYRRARRVVPPAAAAALAIPGAEIIRATWFLLAVGGVPWASPGLALATTPLLPLAAAAGEHGLTIVAVLLGAVFHGIVARSLRPWEAAAAAAVVAGMLATVLLGPRPGTQGSVRCLAIQPNVRVEEKHGGLTLETFLLRQVEVTDEAFAAGADPDVVVWAETMWPFPAVEERDWDADALMRRPWPHREPEVKPMRKLLQQQRESVRWVLEEAPGEVYFLTGSHFYYPVDAGTPPGRMSPRGSEFVLFDHRGRLVQHFSKQELVPFGERLPLGGALPGSDWFVGWVHRNFGLRPDFARRQEAGPLKPLPDLPALGGAVCWENVFERVFREQAAAGARAFCVLSNEDWFGEKGAEMAQMVAATRLRAVETGRAVLRCTNTGVTCLVRADGTVDEGPEPGVPAWWEVDLPLAPAGARTPHVAGGWILARIWLVAALVAAVVPRRRRLDRLPGEG